jgi:hypothetical protein
MIMFLVGLSIGVLSGWSDGYYSAISLFFLPILVALAGASIIADFTATGTVEQRSVTEFKRESVAKRGAVSMSQTV